MLRIRDEIVPVEVKYQTFDSPKISKSLRSFIKSYGVERAMVVTKDYWGKTRIDDTEIVLAPACYL